MSDAAPQPTDFFREVADSLVLWTVRDEGGFPAPLNAAGRRTQPFWSSHARVNDVIEELSDTAAFIPVEVSWDEFCSVWVPGLEQDGILMGLNWSKTEAAGDDTAPSDVQRNVAALLG